MTKKLSLTEELEKEYRIIEKEMLDKEDIEFPGQLDARLEEMIKEYEAKKKAR